MGAMSDYVTICEKAVRAGGAVVQDWIGRIDVREKGPADLVTQADYASQEVIRNTVLDAFPDHCLLGEEQEEAEKLPDRADYRWIADPLDGTTNYVHRVPHYSVSLALEHDGELLVGAVYDPIREECFTATAGGGAYLNGRPIRTSEVCELPEALAIRRTGSSALNLCYLAAGRFDVYWSFSTKIWDVAAGVLIVREAGGAVSGPDGGEFALEEARFLAAANWPLHARLLELVSRARSRDGGRNQVPPDAV